MPPRSEGLILRPGMVSVTMPFLAKVSTNLTGPVGRSPHRKAINRRVLGGRPVDDPLDTDMAIDQGRWIARQMSIGAIVLTLIAVLDALIGLVQGDWRHAASGGGALLVAAGCIYLFTQARRSVRLNKGTPSPTD
jgi:hypothetical protein